MEITSKVFFSDHVVEMAQKYEQKLRVMNKSEIQSMLIMGGIEPNPGPDEEAE